MDPFGWMLLTSQYSEARRDPLKERNVPLESVRGVIVLLWPMTEQATTIMHQGVEGRVRSAT